MLILRSEAQRDAAAIRVVAAAFGQAAEADLVDLVRERGESLVSLVAMDEGVIVGHVMVSPITIGELTGTFAGVAPLSVQPEFQGKGIGSQLMHAAIEACERLGLDALFLLGNPGYYQRFGFRASRLRNEFGATSAFMDLALKPCALDNITGTARYVAAFADVGA